MPDFNKKTLRLSAAGRLNSRINKYATQLYTFIWTVLNEKKFAVSDKKAKNVTNPRRVRK